MIEVYCTSKFVDVNGVPTKVLIALTVMPCNRIYLKGQIHDPHIHVSGTEHVYCTGERSTKGLYPA